MLANSRYFFNIPNKPAFIEKDDNIEDKHTPSEMIEALLEGHHS